MENDMENTEFKKGQIVYVGDSGKIWKLAHYVSGNGISMSDYPYTVNHSYEGAVNGISTDQYSYCLSVEDYHKMLNQPKDKNLVWASDRPSEFIRAMRLYDSINNRIFNNDSGRRNGHSFQNNPDDLKFEDGDFKKVDDFGYVLDKGYRVSYDAEGVGGFKKGFRQESEAIDYLKSNGSGGHITRVLEKLHTEVREVKSFEIIEL